jgi:hypothetical protein
LQQCFRVTARVELAGGTRFLYHGIAVRPVGSEND